MRPTSLLSLHGNETVEGQRTIGRMPHEGELVGRFPSVLVDSCLDTRCRTVLDERPEARIRTVSRLVNPRLEIILNDEVPASEIRLRSRVIESPAVFIVWTKMKRR